jgi:hypothetical protein
MNYLITPSISRSLVLRLMKLPVMDRKLKYAEKFPVKPIFILSTGRTGTNFFADFFSKHPKVTALHEPKPSRILRMWSNARLEGYATNEELVRVLSSKRKKLVKSIQTPLYIESNPFIVGFAPVLNQVFEEPIIIHVVRDPRDYIRSALNHGNTKGLKKLFNSSVPFWYPKVSRLIRKDVDDSLMLRTAGYWKVINEWLLKNKNSNNYHLFKFEDLFNDKKELKRLAKIVGIEPAFIDKNPPKATNRSKDKVVNSWEKWSKEDCIRIQEICGPEMKLFGYGNEKEWLRKIS